jgi:leucyl-tRNA synthetase
LSDCRRDVPYLARLAVEIAVQLDGKVRSRITLPADAGRRSKLPHSRTRECGSSWRAGRRRRWVIVVPGKLVSIVL